MTKEARIYNGEKIACSKLVLGILASHMEKNEIRTLPNTIHKNKLKMDLRLRYKTRYYKTLRGKHRPNTLRHKPQKHLLRSTYQSIDNKNKNKQMGPIQTSKFLHSKGNPKQHKNTSHRMGENLCK